MIKIDIYIIVLEFNYLDYIFNKGEKISEQDKVKCEKLFDETNNLICDEFYFQFYENKEINPIWYQGLKKVYDANDKTGEFDIESAIEYMDDDQETMLEIINYLIGSKMPNGVANNIYVNYIFNKDGSTNLIKQLMISYEINKDHHLVIRVPMYAFSEYALNDFVKKIRSNY